MNHGQSDERDIVREKVSRLNIGSVNSDLTFAQIYGYLKSNHPTLMDLDDSDVLKFETLINPRLRDVTLEHVTIGSALVFFVLLTPILIQLAYEISKQLHGQVTSAFSIIPSVDEQFGLIAGVALATLTLFVVLFIPFGSRIEFLQNKASPPGKVHFLTQPFILSFLAGTILFSTLLQMLFYSFRMFPSAILLEITWVWILIIMVGLAVFLSIVAMALFGSMFEYIINRRGGGPDPLRRVILGICLLIHHIDEDRSIAFMDNHKREKVVNLIILVGQSIENLYSQNVGRGESVIEWTFDQMRCARQSFLALIPAIYFPQGSKDWVMDQMIEHLNVFLSGEYHRLPRRESSQTFERFSEANRGSLLRKLASISFIAIYLFLPIAVFFLLSAVLKIEIPPLIQTALSVFYVIWAGLGILSFAEKFNPEVKELLTNVLKSAFGGK